MRVEQVLVEAAPVDADAHRLAVAAGGLDHRRELRVALAAAADVAGIDAVLGERCRAGGMRREQLVPVEVEVADQRHVAARCAQPVADLRNGCGRLVGVDRDAHELRAGLRQLAHLVRAVASTSAVSVFVIDWTTTGTPPPTVTAPMRTATCCDVPRSLAFWAAIHPSTVRSRTSSGTAPVASTASWNARMS